MVGVIRNDTLSAQSDDLEVTILQTDRNGALYIQENNPLQANICKKFADLVLLEAYYLDNNDP